jgi:hypothetical protein
MKLTSKIKSFYKKTTTKPINTTTQQSITKTMEPPPKETKQIL